MMRAAWWWIDRWRKSTAYMCMNAEEQGLYRNLLDAVWLFEDGIIPDDKHCLSIASGGDPDAWERSGAKVLQWMQRRGHGWTNTTALEVKAKTEDLHTKRVTAGRKGGLKRVAKAQAKLEANGQAKSNSPSPSPSPSPLYRSNPFVQGAARSTLEAECLDLVHRESVLTNRDPAEILAEAADYEGSRRQKVNPAAMTDDRLLNTVLDLRKRVEIAEREKGRGNGN